MKIKSSYEDNYWWVEIPDELWYNSIQTDYLDGYPIHTKRPYHPVIINTGV